MKTKTLPPITVQKLLIDGDVKPKHCFRWPEDNWYYASDGRIAVATEEPLEGIEYGNVVNGSFRPVDVFVKVSESKRSPTIVDYKRETSCLRCDGSGFLNKKDCAKCNGHGTIECETCGHETNCSQCRAKGWMSADKCTCDDGQIGKAARVGRMLINTGYFDVFSSLPNSRIAGTGKMKNGTGVVLFEWSGGKACVCTLVDDR